MHQMIINAAATPAAAAAAVPDDIDQTHQGLLWLRGPNCKAVAGATNLPTRQSHAPAEQVGHNQQSHLIVTLAGWLPFHERH
jgi:hypothetical protein